MKYTAEYTQQAVRDLRKLDNQTRTFILSWIEKNLVDCENPRQHGKGLTANRSGQWRYRVGDYRLIADIQNDKVVILLLHIGHRRDVYGE